MPLANQSLALVPGTTPHSRPGEWKPPETQPLDLLAGPTTLYPKIVAKELIREPSSDQKASTLAADSLAEKREPKIKHCIRLV